MSCEDERLATFRISSDVDGPRDNWRIGGDGTADKGNSVRYHFRQRSGIGSTAVDGWSQGSKLEFMFPLTPVVLSDYPTVNADREVDASKLDRLESLGKIH